MPDIFTQNDVKELLKNKKVVFLGDSNIRAVYKDFLILLNYNTFVEPEDFRKKLEDSFCGDRMVSSGGLCRGREFREERIYKESQFNIRFYFITKVLGDYVYDILDSFRREQPDIVIVNSCLWDITRWGPMSIDFYKDNLPKFFSACRQVLNPKAMLIWLTTPPISSNMRSSLLVGRLDFLTPCLRFHVVQANHYAKKIVSEMGFDIVDTHYHLQHYIHLRAKDGVHWLSPAVRYITNLVLTHMALSLDQPLPGKIICYTARHGHPDKFKLLSKSNLFTDASQTLSRKRKLNEDDLLQTPKNECSKKPKPDSTAASQTPTCKPESNEDADLSLTPKSEPSKADLRRVLNQKRVSESELSTPVSKTQASNPDILPSPFAYQMDRYYIEENWGLGKQLKRERRYPLKRYFEQKKKERKRKDWHRDTQRINLYNYNNNPFSVPPHYLPYHHPLPPPAFNFAPQNFEFTYRHEIDFNQNFGITNQPWGSNYHEHPPRHHYPPRNSHFNNRNNFWDNSRPSTSFARDYY